MGFGGTWVPDVAGTLWAAFIGVTEWQDHRKSRQTDFQPVSHMTPRTQVELSYFF